MDIAVTAAGRVIPDDQEILLKSINDQLRLETVNEYKAGSSFVVPYSVGQWISPTLKNKSLVFMGIDFNTVYFENYYADTEETVFFNVTAVENFMREHEEAFPVVRWEVDEDMLERVEQNYIDKQYAANLSEERLNEPAIAVLAPTEEGLYTVVIDGTHRMYERIRRHKEVIMPVRFIAVDVAIPAMTVNWRIANAA